jgi:hypothetical protein
MASTWSISVSWHIKASSSIRWAIQKVYKSLPRPLIKLLAVNIMESNLNKFQIPPFTGPIPPVIDNLFAKNLYPCIFDSISI